MIQNISSYYRQVLNQIVICSLPNGLTIVRAGRSNSGLHELDTLLNLLINAAVNSDNKECYITYIKSFDHHYQAEIARRITSTSEDYVAEISVPEVTYSNSKTIESHLEQLLKYLSEVSSERDQSKRALNEALQERDQIAQNTGIDFLRIFHISNSKFVQIVDFQNSPFHRISGSLKILTPRFRRFIEFPVFR